MRLLFLGGGGMISTATSRAAIDADHEVYVLNRGLTAAALLGSHTLTADVRDLDASRAALDGLEFDAAVDWIAYTVDDVERHMDLLRSRVGQFVFISSASVYDKPPANYLITESTPLRNPFWQYARDKIACEDRLMRAYRDEGCPVTIVRPSMTYDHNLPIALGGWGTYTLADRLLTGRPVIVHGDGSSLWVVTHADDLARGILGLLGNARAIGEAFHITSDEVLSWNRIYRTIAEALGVEADIVHIPSDFIADVAPQMAGSLLGDKTWSVVFDNSKIREFVPGFEARIPLRDGIQRTLDWFAADASRRTVDAAVNTELDRILSAYGR